MRSYDENANLILKTGIWYGHSEADFQRLDKNNRTDFKHFKGSEKCVDNLISKRKKRTFAADGFNDVSLFSFFQVPSNEEIARHQLVICGTS